MLRATLKSLLARKLRLVLSGFAVVLGVMAVAGALILGDTLNSSVGKLFSGVYEGTDVVVTGKTFVDASSEGGVSTSQPVPANLITQLQTLPDAAAVQGVVAEDGARVVGKDNKIITSNGPPRLGLNWTGENKQTHLRRGRGPQSDNEVAINVPLAEQSGFTIGDRINVLTKEPKQALRVVGIYGVDAHQGSLGGETSVSFTEETAQHLMLGKIDAFSRVKLKAKSGVSQGQLRNEVKTKLGNNRDDFVVKTGVAASKENADQLQSFVSVVKNVLLGFAAVALFVGVFLILNTFSILVAQRTRELALFRAMGAGRGQVIRSVMLEAMAVGIIASTLGLAAGVGIAKLLLEVLGSQSDGSELFKGSFAVPVSAVIASYVVGVIVTLIVTLIAALIPALRASRIPPVAALREATVTARPLTKVTIAGVAATALGLAGILLALFANASVVLLLLGVLLSFIGVAMLTPAITRPVVGVMGWALSWSLPGKLGQRNAARNPRRTAITASALMIGLALVTGVSVIASSLTASIEKSVERDIKASLFIAGDSFGGGSLVTFDAQVVDQVKQLPGVSDAAAYYGDFAKLEGRVQFVTAVDPSDLTKVTDVSATQGRLGDLKAGSVLIDDSFAKSNKLKVGNKLDITTTNGGLKSFAVAAIYKRTVISQGPIMSVADAKTDFGRPGPIQALIAVDKDASVDAVKKRVAKLLADNPEVSVQSQEEISKRAATQVNQFVLVLYVLLGLAIVIAVLGIINTLALSILERTRELGLLRAVGLSRAKTRRMITAESIVISVFGALLGIVVGCGLGALIVTALKDQGLQVLAFP
ncbi:MAG: ABC transporter permease [Acidimicrobiales bacterium]|nr:MAG: ABC transporter permease [Acidimicrobiales bacterium]